MSATLRLEDFTENKRLFRITPPVIKIDSRQFPVTIHFNRVTKEDYLSEAYKKACKIHRKLPDGGILIFVTGQQEVHTMCAKLRRSFPFRKGFEERFSENKTGEIEEKSSLPEINLDDYSIIPTDEQAEIEEETLPTDVEGDVDDDQEDEEEEGDEDEHLVSSRIAHEEPMHVLPLYSLLASDKQAKVFQPPPEGSRLCVVATNVAETSLTIPNIKYVVDCGKVKTKFFDKVTGVSTFKVTWSSQAAANQRSGRAGRTAPGHCYRLFSSAVFTDFEKFSAPEISRRPVDDLVLQMKSMNIEKVLNFPFPTPPSREALESAEKLLLELGALDRVADKKGKKSGGLNGRINSLGKVMAKFPVSPRYGKMLCLADQKNLLSYVVAIVASLSVQDVFVSTYHSAEENTEEHTKQTMFHKQRKAWAGSGQSLLLGDLMVLLKAVGACEYAGSTFTFCQQYGMRYKAIVEIRKLRAQLTNTVKAVIPNAKIILDPKMEPPDAIQTKLLRQIVLSGMTGNVAKKIPDLPKGSEDAKKLKHAYQCIALEEPVFVHPASVLYKQNLPYIVYQHIDETSKLYMKGVSAIEPEWLPIYAPNGCLFSKPLEDPPPRYDSDSGHVVCHMTSSFGAHYWAVPAVEVEYPKGIDKYKHFAKHFLEGDVCTPLKQFQPFLLSPSITMLKSWARLQPRTQSMLNALVSSELDTKEKLCIYLSKNKQGLLDNYLEWLPESLHDKVRSRWPPI